MINTHSKLFVLIINKYKHKIRREINIPTPPYVQKPKFREKLVVF